MFIQELQMLAIIGHSSTPAEVHQSLKKAILAGIKLKATHG
jgi:hypothetical protein